jgi:hypothetical protein
MPSFFSYFFCVAALPLPPHPRILLDDVGLLRVNTSLDANAEHRAVYAAVLQAGFSYLSAPVTPYSNCTVVGACRNTALFGSSAGYVNAGGARSLIVTCALLHRLRRDNASAAPGGGSVWSARALLELDNLLSWPSWYWPVAQALERAELAAAASVAYDWLHDLLPPAARLAVEDAIGEKALRTRLTDELEGMWWIGDVYNWNVNANSGVAVAALAVGDVPRWAAVAESVRVAALASIPAALASFAPGLWPESQGYQAYTTGELIYLAETLRLATGGDSGLIGAPGVCASGAATLYLTGATEQVFNYGDASPAVDPRAAFSLAYLAARCAAPAYAYRARSLLLAQPALATPEALIFFSTAGTREDVLGLPLTRAFADPSPDRARGAKTHVATFRSAWLNASAAFLAVKGGDNFFDDHGSQSHNNHGHLDVGSFVVEADGQRWAIDMGAGLYDYPYLSYFGRFRFSYFVTSSAAHNVLSFDGVTQHRRGQGRIVNSGAGFALLDVTSAYGGAAFVLRNVSLAGRVATIADAWAHPGAANATFTFLTAAAVTLTPGGASVTLAQGKAGMRVDAAPASGAPAAWTAQRLSLAVPQVDTYAEAGGVPGAVFVVSVTVPASEGGLSVRFTPTG